MRILYVTDGIAPYVIGGMQTIARRHIEWLAQAGHDVFAAVPERPLVPAGALPATLVPIPWRKRGLRDRINPWRYVHDLRAYGHGVAGLIDEIRPDVVYSEGPLVDALLDRPRADHAPIVFHPHGLETFQDLGAAASDLKTLPLKGIVARHARRADIVISQGGSLDDLLVRLIGAPPGRLRRLFNTAVSGRRRTPHTSATAAPPGSSLSGAMNRGKVCPYSSRRCPRSPGHRSRSWASHALTPRLPLMLRFTAKSATRKSSQEFIVRPTSSSFRALPRACRRSSLEAFAHGVPVIASDVGAVASAVIEGRTGFLVRPGDVSGLAGAMRRAAALSDDEYRAMSAASRAAMEGEFSPARVRSAFLGIVDEAAALGRVRKSRA